MSNSFFEGEYPNQFIGIDGNTDANAGVCNLVSAPLKLHTKSLIAKADTAGAILSSGAGVPTIGGNVGDLYIRTDGNSDALYFYRCTTAGAAGAAVWAAITGA